MTEASKNAYRNAKNKVKRDSQKARIYEIIKWNLTTEIAGWTALEMARELKLPAISMVKRLSDLFKDGKVRVTGIRNGFSIYKEDTHRRRLTLGQAYHIALREYLPSQDVAEIEVLVNHLSK